MRVVLVGAVESTRVALETLIGIGSPPVALVTLPADVRSRHSDAVELSELAERGGARMILSSDINAPESLASLAALEPDLILVVGWSQVCRKPFRESARLGCIGFHPSALPKLRGRAVIPWTILTRQTESGSTFFWLDDGIDTGDIVAQRIFALDDEETARTLYDKQMESIRILLPDVIEQFASRRPRRQRQLEKGASYCARRGPEDGVIHWREPASDILTLIRAVCDPYPGAFTSDGGRRIVVKAARIFPDGERFIGMAGQVQAFTENGFVVRCGDGACIEVLDWRSEDGKKPRRHAVLGRG